MAPKSGKISATKKSASTENANKAQRLPPNWPGLLPLVPASDLAMQALLQDQILTIPRFWTAALCKSYVSFLSSLPLVTTPRKVKKGEAVRVNDRYQIDDPLFAEKLWSGTALQELVRNPIIEGIELDESSTRKLWGGDVLGLNPNIRIYRYQQGQFFDQHYTIPAKTTWTLLLYLTSPATGCQGGETVFYPEPPSKRAAAPPPVVAELDVGMALLHRHGNECLLHEGREVMQGEKWVIRSDLVVKR